MEIFIKVQFFNIKVLFNLDLKMDSENIFMQKLDKSMKDNGVMIFGMAKDNILLFLNKLLLKEFGQMDYFMVKFKRFIKMVKGL
jgi:hypothetical protein